MSQYAGWVGALTILVAYYCVTNEILGARSYRYQCLNVLGSAGIATSALATHSLPSVGLNVVWMLIACLSMLRTYRLARARRDSVG